MSKDDKEFLSLEEVADMLAVNYQLIYRLVRSGELPAVKLGRVYRVRRADMNAYLQQSLTGKPTGFDCGACGKHYASMVSHRADCPDTGKPICLDCWDRLGIRSCKDLDPKQ